jgi:hypothetical protein
MKRQPYFPRQIGLRAGWFNNFAVQLPIANAILQLPAASVTACVNEARYGEYACGVWLTGTREFGPSSTSAIEDLLNGTGGDPFVLPTYTVPALPAGVTSVPPGLLLRLFAFVQTIKASPFYTEAIGLQLGIVGAEDATENPLPTFSLKSERGDGCQCVKVIFKKYGRQGVVVFSRRGGGAWEMLAIDLASPYMDERPLLVAGQPEVREYRLQYYDNAAPTGEFTPVESTTVTP